MVTHFHVGTNRPIERLNLHVSSVSPLLKSYRDAFSDPNWQNAMRDEYSALIKNKTWVLVPRPTDTNIVRCMWLFHHKYLADGTLSRYKAHLVANGSTQFEGVDVDETFSPVVKPGTIRTVLSLAVSRHWLIHQLDKKYAIEILEKAYMVNCNSSRTHIDSESKLGADGDPIYDPTLYRSLADYGLQLFSSSTTDLVAYSDADWAGCPTTRRYTSGYCVFLGNNLLSWSVKHQPTLSRSSTEAEYHRVASIVAETCWLRNLQRELHTPLSSATIVYCDNVSDVYLSSNPVQHQRTKHIEIDIHFVRDLVAAGHVRVLHVPSRYQFVDIFTKGLRSALFEEFHTSLSVKDKQEKDKIGSKPDKKGKQCSSCGALYTGDFCCSKGNVEDKILVPKPHKNCARCAKCRHPNISVSSDDSTNVVNAPREPVVVKQDHGVNPPHVDECCCKCGNALDGIFCQQCICFDQTQTPQFPVIHPPPQETSIKILHDHENVINSVQTLLRKFNRYSFFETPKELAEYINTPGWNRPAFYDDDDDDDDMDYTIAITPVLSTEEPINSLSMGYEHLDTIPATESDEVIKSSVKDLIPIPSESEGIPEHMCDVPFHDNSPLLDVSKDQIEDFFESNNEVSSIDDDSFSIDNIDFVEASPPDSELVSSEVMEIVIPKVGGIDDDILLTIKDDNLREKLLNVHLLITNIEALKDNPTQSFEFLTKSSYTSSKSFLEETNTFHNSLPEFENFYFDLEEISSGSTTTHSDISLPDYEAFFFNNDHIKEISSSSTTTHYDISVSEYDSFIFDLLNDQCPPTDRSDFTHEEFADELAHIISPPEYDCFYFRDLPDLGELISIFNFEIHENLSTTSVNLPIEDDHFPLLAYVVWIFLAYLTYPVIPPYLHPFGNEDTIFDPGITINHVYSFKHGLSHRCGAFKKFNTHRSHLNECPMIINEKITPILDVLLFHFYPP
uniref:Ribonuclease H-like domain-containing protein n=1 Tax=Tanacetum cinerariifolium TaxID=118510 RepID=A0A6L2L172_TANCI|nr:ribonuclease H-like domain-containing protein [Tanacetum cinerariifolium]